MMNADLELVLKIWEEKVPDPIVKLLFVKCPVCGKRTWNAHGAERLGYLVHYLDEHPIDYTGYLKENNYRRTSVQ